MSFVVISEEKNNVERLYKIDGHKVKAIIDYDKETIRLRAHGFENLYPISVYLKFQGDMEEFIKKKVFLNGH
jgi:hypothetical protein